LFYRHGETERSLLDLGILVGLGFGVTEFALYVFTLGVPFISRVSGVIFHASSTGITAYGIAKKKPVPFYLVAVAFHLANNFFCFILKLVLVLVHTWTNSFDCHLSPGVVSLPPNLRNHGRVALTRANPLRSGLPAYTDMRLGY
jgi:RsiW-degrading membrane proteinase PrsW (M82 family)